MEKVLVTGATGYIGLHCIQQLLDQGYAVNGSLRSLERKDEIFKSLESHNTSTEHLKLFSFNLNEDEGWDDGMEGCDYLIHVASPIALERKSEDFFVKPAVAGVKRALKFAKKHNIKKVILTSSVAAIFHGIELKEYYDENDWSDPENPSIDHYSKSKTLAEKAAWDFINNDNELSFSMTTIHPGMVFGPLLINDIDGASAELLSKMINGKFPALPDAYFTVVDVRDVAKLHVESLRKNQSDNKRIIATSPQGINIMEISNILRKNGYKKAPQNFIPTKMINSLAPFNKEMKSMAAMVNRGSYGADITETISIYNWEPIPLEKTLIDMGNSIK